MLRIRLFGQIKIEYNNECIDNKLTSKIIALIYILIANKGKYISKDTIMYYLWPESSEDAARYNLRYNLWILKKVIPLDDNGDSFIIVNKDTCILNEKYPLECDFLVIKEIDEKSASINELLYAKNLFCGNIMDGWYLKDCNDFNEKLLSDRMFCEMRRTKIIKSLASKYEYESNLDKALEILIEDSEREPDNEETALNIMKLYVQANKKSSAINYYNKFKADLWNDLGLTPNAEIEEFFREIYKMNHNEQQNLTNELKKNADIEVKVVCIADIEFFAISQIILKIYGEVGYNILDKLNRYVLTDLASVCTRILEDDNSSTRILPENLNTTPKVRILQAFCNMLEIIVQYYRVNLIIEDKANLDNISKEILDYLKKMELKNLSITEI